MYMIWICDNTGITISSYGGMVGDSDSGLRVADGYPLVNVYITNWKNTKFNGYINKLNRHFQ